MVTRTQIRSGEKRWKEFTTVTRAVGEREIEFIASTSSVDREGDTIAVDGWDLTAFRRNPVILWAHDYRALPIGRATRVAVENGKLITRVQFATAAEYPFADTVLQLVKGGYLNAVSVGFLPTRWAYNEQRGGVDFLEQELLEVSVVPVPANAEALVAARSLLGGEVVFGRHAFPAGLGRSTRRPPMPADDDTIDIDTDEFRAIADEVFEPMRRSIERAERRRGIRPLPQGAVDIDERQFRSMVEEAFAPLRERMTRLDGRID